MLVLAWMFLLSLIGFLLSTSLGILCLMVPTSWEEHRFSLLRKVDELLPKVGPWFFVVGVFLLPLQLLLGLALAVVLVS